MTKCTALIDQYCNWLKQESSCEALDDNWVEITLPFLDRHNDYIQIYVKKIGSEILITDDGETLHGLRQEGCAIDRTKHKELLGQITRSYGVSIDREQLQIITTLDDFASSKHSLIQAILSVNDMYFLKESNVSN